jgi:hypothetical protein
MDVEPCSPPEPVDTPQKRQDDILSSAERFLAEQAGNAYDEFLRSLEW